MLSDDDVVLKGVRSPPRCTSAAGCTDRCVQLELSLQRVKSHSTKVRQSLLGKIVKLEKRALEAEAKSQESVAEIQRLLQENMDLRLSSARRSSSCPSPELTRLQCVVEEKEKVISSLEREVQQQKQLRLQDAKQVEEKAAKIKEWVSVKLKVRCSHCSSCSHASITCLSAGNGGPKSVFKGREPQVQRPTARSRAEAGECLARDVEVHRV